MLVLVSTKAFAMTGGVCPSATASEYFNQAGKAVRRAYTYTHQTFMVPIKVPINNLWPEYELFQQLNPFLGRSIVISGDERGGLLSSEGNEGEYVLNGNTMTAHPEFKGW